MVAASQWRYICLVLFISSSDGLRDVRRLWPPTDRGSMEKNFDTVSHGCGVSAGEMSGSRIVGGEDVNSYRYPFFAALVPKDDLLSLSVNCGGTLITRRHVLSAAHCFQSNRPLESLYIVVFRLLNRCNLANRNNLVYRNAAKVYVHPDFNIETLVADIAIMALAIPVNLTPACLPPRGATGTGDGIIIGFGSRKVKEQSTYPCVMQQAQVQIFSKQQCMASDLKPEYADLAGTFCAGDMAGGVDSCDGDSGGPLLTVSNNIYTVQGIVSFGEGCGRKDLPGVYTRVSYYRTWIDNKIRYSNTGNHAGLIGSILQHLFPNKDFGKLNHRDA